MPTDPSIRLPASVRPERYVLTLKPDLEAFVFQGEEEVALRLDEPTSEIVVNAVELDIQEAWVTMNDGTARPAKAIAVDGERETATFAFEEELPPGPATLAIRFAGTLNDQLRGFYRSRYETPQGETRWMAATQFEATDARRGFPCWDEPAFKATFRATLVVPEDLVALSNTPVEREEPRGDGTKAVTFQETPPMSPYLLAFVVGDLASVESVAAGGTQVRVWAVRGREQLGRLALENAVQLLSYLHDYFGIPYPLPKLDHVALPDFAAGAMENWGCITYRERVLLYDPDESAALTKQRIVEVLAHEMAHMWFGDLVTMGWWDDLWLNESFASWMGNKATDALYPEWAMWAQFLYQDTVQGLALDGLRTSHPIEVAVRDPHEIEEIFDQISYSKGAAILWMLEGFLGEDAFRRGLQKYLGKHAYGNARTADLWKALGQASGEPVVALMDSWVQQTGFPLLTASARRQEGALDVTLSQERFLYTHLLGDGEREALWKIPVGIRRAGKPDPKALLMEEREATLSLGRAVVPEEEDWWKANASQTGFYRVRYPEEEWTRVRRAVEGKELPATDRLGLENDLYALTRAGHVPATLYLSFAEAYRDEDDATVWRDLVANLQGLESLLASEPLLDPFHGYVRDLCRPAAHRAGWDPHPGEGHLDVLLRNAVLLRLGGAGDDDTLEEARRRFGAFREDPGSLRADLREVVYPLTAQEADRATYEALWELERAATLNEEKVRLLVALGKPRHRDLLEETLERSLSGEVRAQDTVFVVQSVASNVRGRELAWDFVKENWGEFLRRYGGGFLLRRLVSVAEGFASPDRAEEVEDFFRAHEAPGAKRTIRQTEERIRLNAAWLAVNREGLQAYLRDRG